MPPPVKRNLRRLYTLTQAPDGPTGKKLEQIAKDIVLQARENAFEFSPAFLSKHPEVLNTIQYVRRGNEIRIGIRPDMPAGPKNYAYFLASKEAKEHNWLEPAVEDVMRFESRKGRKPAFVALRGGG